MKDWIGIGDINGVIFTINTKFLNGKCKIGAKWKPNEVTIYQMCEGKNDLIIKEGLSLIGAYYYLIGFKKGFTAPHWG